LEVRAGGGHCDRAVAGAGDVFGGAGRVRARGAAGRWAAGLGGWGGGHRQVGPGRAAANDLPDARWAWGACDGLFTPRPLGPLFDLAGQVSGELDDLCRAGAAREDLFRALLRQVSERGALSVLVVEDIHWADEATVDLLRFLGRRLRDAPVLLIATYRGEDLAADDPLRAALGEIARQRSTRRIDLAPLSADAAMRSTPRAPRLLLRAARGLRICAGH
jgi:hypothetical protein